MVSPQRPDVNILVTFDSRLKTQNRRLKEIHIFNPIIKMYPFSILLFLALGMITIMALDKFDLDIIVDKGEKDIWEYRIQNFLPLSYRQSIKTIRNFNHPIKNTSFLKTIRSSRNFTYFRSIINIILKRQRQIKHGIHNGFSLSLISLSENCICY